MNNKNRVLNEWYNLFQQINPSLSDLAYKHWNNVIQCGVPSFKKNTWKYDVFEEFFKNHFIFNEHKKLNLVHNFNASKLCINSNTLVFINGNLSSELSDISIDPWILELDQGPSRYNVLNPINSDMFVYLTECLSHSMIRIILPEKTITKKPLYLFYITIGSKLTNQLVTSHYYYNVNIGKYTESSIIEHFISIDNNESYFNGTRMIISVGSGAKLNHIKLIFENSNSYHIAHQDIHPKEGSCINSNIFVIGPKFIHHQINSRIDNSKIVLSLNSLVSLSQHNIGNIHTYLEHSNKNYSASKQLHKIIANDSSIGMFTGLIKVNKNSIKTDAKMTNNNLLLNQNASIYSVPKLEIYSDAVQCSHGSSIGQINSDHLFYLGTRGISKNNAVKMLISAFTAEIINTIQSSLLKEIIIKKMNQDLIRRI